MALVKWDFDYAHSGIDFTVRHLLVSKVRGRFTKWTGKLELDEENLSKSTCEVEIDVTSVETHEPQRDAHLRSGDYPLLVTAEDLAVRLVGTTPEP